MSRTDRRPHRFRWIVSLGAIVASGLVWGATAAAEPVPADPVPVQAADDPDDGVSLIHAFGEHTCGVQDDRLYCWGSASDGRLGKYGFKDTFRRRPSPRFGYGLSEADYMLDTTGSTFDNSGSKPIIGMGGLYTTCVIQGSVPGATAGTVYCWGFNSAGQVGNGTSASVNIPAAASAPGSNLNSTPFDNSRVLAVDGGFEHTCVIEGASGSATDGTLFCWGADKMLGIGQASSTARSLSARQVGTDPNVSSFSNTSVEAVSAGFSHTCAIEAGTVYCWGGNGDQLGGWGIFDPRLWGGLVTSQGGTGRAGRPASESAIGIPMPVLSGGGFANETVEAVSAGYRHTCAIEAGSVYCWGNNSSGQLGDGTTTSAATPVKVVAGGGFTNTNVDQVVAGDHHTCAVEAGSVFCWGDRVYGRLGDGVFEGWARSVPASTPVKVADGAMGNSGVSLADGSGAHMCATKAGKAFCWGAGEKWNTLSDGSMTTDNYFMDGYPRLSDARTPRLVRWVPPEFDEQDAPRQASEPLNVSAESGWGVVRVTWDPPTDLGGGASAGRVWNYLVRSEPRGGVCIVGPGRRSLNMRHECEFTNLKPGTDYTFTVQALTGYGWGAASAASNVASPKRVTVTSFERKRPFLSFIVGTDVRVSGTAIGVPTGTKLIPIVSVGNGLSWTGSPTTVNADGTFTWQRRFGRNDSGEPIRVSFIVDGDASSLFAGRSNEIRLDPTTRGRSRSASDLGGMPSTSEPTTDIQFGFEENTQLGGDLPVQFRGSGLEPGSTVTATLSRSAPSGFTDVDLWAEDFTDASNVVDDFGDVFTIVSLPNDLAAGFYSVTFTGTAPDGTSVSESNGIVVSENPTAQWQIDGLYSQGVNLEPERRILGLSDDTPRPTAEPETRGVTAVTPTRLVDTRTAEALEAGEVIEVPVIGRGGVPTDATAVMLNVTATEHVGDDGFLTVYPCGASRPDTSNLNLNDGETVANAATVDLDDTGKVCVYSFKPTEVVVDLMGYASPDSEMLLNHVATSRLLDTRKWESPRPVADDVVEVEIPGAADGVVAVALNVTIVDADDDDAFVTVYPCGVARPDTSNANAPEGGTAAGGVLVPVGAGGKVCVYTSVGADILVDISGEYRTDVGMGLQVHGATRVVDSRKVSPLRTVTDEEWGTLEETDEETVGIRLAADSTQRVSIHSGYAGSAAAIVANVTVENPAAAGFLTVYDCSVERPDTSNLNYVARQNRANQVVMPVTSDTLCVYTLSEVSLIVDVVGRYVDN